MIIPEKNRFGKNGQPFIRKDSDDEEVEISYYSLLKRRTKT
jgi:hypothetical protein